VLLAGHLKKHVFAAVLYRKTLLRCAGNCADPSLAKVAAEIEPQESFVRCHPADIFPFERARRARQKHLPCGAVVGRIGK
jgi:hypothetical protein